MQIMHVHFVYSSALSSSSLSSSSSSSLASVYFCLSRWHVRCWNGRTWLECIHFTTCAYILTPQTHHSFDPDLATKCLLWCHAALSPTLVRWLPSLPLPSPASPSLPWEANPLPMSLCITTTKALLLLPLENLYLYHSRYHFHHLTPPTPFPSTVPQFPSPAHCGPEQTRIET